MRVPTAVPDIPRVPLTIVGGDAGAGKTTMLGQLIVQEQSRDVTVVLDSIEQLALDSHLLAHREGQYTTLTNGALCCAFPDDLSAELSELRRQLPQSAHVIVEVCGGASLRRVAGYGYMPGYRSDGIVVVMSAQDMQERLPDPEQRLRMTADLRAADLLVMNKVDVVDSRKRSQVHAWLDAELPQLRVIETVRGRVPVSLLLGVSPALARTDARAVPGSWDSATYRPVGRKRQGRAAATDAGEQQCRVWNIETDRPIMAQRFRSWISLLPRNVVRGNGDVLIEEDPRVRYRFQMIGHRWQLRPDTPWGDTPPETQLALVGM